MYSLKCQETNKEEDTHWKKEREREMGVGGASYILVQSATNLNGTNLELRTGNSDQIG